MPRVTDSRTRMLEATERLLRLQGLHATGLAQVIEESGAPRGSLYYHFPGGKEQLAEEAVRDAGERLAEGLRAIRAAATSPADALRLYGAMAAKRLRDTDFGAGCPVFNTALEASVTSPAVREACDGALRDWEGVVADWLVGEGVEAERAAELGTFVIAAIEGALGVARARRETAPLETVVEQLATLLESV